MSTVWIHACFSGCSAVTENDSPVPGVHRICVSEGTCVNKHVRMCAYLEECLPMVNVWRHSGRCPGDYSVSVGAGCSGPGGSTWSWDSSLGSSAAWSIPPPQTPPAQNGDRTSGVSTRSLSHRNKDLWFYINRCSVYRMLPPFHWGV